MLSLISTRICSGIPRGPVCLALTAAQVKFAFATSRGTDSVFDYFAEILRNVGKALSKQPHQEEDQRRVQHELQHSVANQIAGLDLQYANQR